MSERILQRDPVEMVKQAFKLFDSDHSGKIGFSDLRKVAEELGEVVDEDELRAMLDEFDLDGDGEIDEKEFMAIMLDD